MGVLRRNAGKLALIALIVFFSLPFIYGNEEENDFSPFAVKSGLSYQANPISKLANRIASFYGLPKSNRANVGEINNNNVSSSIRGRVAGHQAFNKQDVSNIAAANAQNKNQAALTDDNKQKLNNLEKDPTIYEPARATQMATTATGVNYDRYYYNKPQQAPVVEYVQINGENYKIIKDITGHKYVATAKGHIPYEEVMRTTVSEREFLAAKKKLVNASDAEIVDYVLAQKQGTNRPANTAQPQPAANNYRDSYSRGGTATKMDNEAVNYGNSLETDTGFDDSILNNAYDEVKNIGINGSDIAPAVVGSLSNSNSSRGNSSNGGSSSGSYYNNGNTNRDSSYSGSTNNGNSRNSGNYYASNTGFQGDSDISNKTKLLEAVRKEGGEDAYKASVSTNGIVPVAQYTKTSNGVKTLSGGGGTGDGEKLKKEESNVINIRTFDRSKN